MLLKLMGICMVMGGAFGILFAKETEYTQHKRQLTDFEQMLMFLQNEICLLHLPIPVVLGHGAKELHHLYGLLCQEMLAAMEQQTQADATQIWKDALEQFQEDILLRGEEYRLLEQIGTVFRMDDVSLKEELFGIYREQLTRLLSDYETSLVTKRRLSRYGTILAGVFFIILFV